MNDEDVLRYVTQLDETQFFHLIQALLASRVPFEEELEFHRNHFVCAVASQLIADAGDCWEPWTTYIVATPDFDYYEADTRFEGLVQFGDCPTCRLNVVGLAKQSLCAVCGTRIQLT